MQQPTGTSCLPRRREAFLSFAFSFVSPAALLIPRLANANPIRHASKYHWHIKRKYRASKYILGREWASISLVPPLKCIFLRPKLFYVSTSTTTSTVSTQTVCFQRYVSSLNTYNCAGGRKKRAAIKTAGGDQALTDIQPTPKLVHSSFFSFTLLFLYIIHMSF